MPGSLIHSYDRWSKALEQAHVMASAAELHGLMSGLLSGGLSAKSADFIAVLYDFLNDGQALPAALKADVQQLISNTAISLQSGEYDFALLLPNEDDALVERLEAMVEWTQAFLVGFAVQQTDLSLVSEDVREAVEQLTEVTKVDLTTSSDSSAEENEEAYYMVLEHIRLMVFSCFNDVGQKFQDKGPVSKTLH
ncbi:UPF0149 family protein [Alishewanella sp. 16-MA]|uniref:UPF0149 family protein n=1 Tax=Alishewanella maricola TaxID=2795740 RepID=A0ABS8C0J7_9ALTE|nr:UPF0149 family protein [Alishewanella maricola]MCB5225846.1 UPF0149 family protein [Alishewanella maricola]